MMKCMKIDAGKRRLENDHAKGRLYKTPITYDDLAHEVNGKEQGKEHR